MKKEQIEKLLLKGKVLTWGDWVYVYREESEKVYYMRQYEYKKVYKVFLWQGEVVESIKSFSEGLSFHYLVKVLHDKKKRKIVDQCLNEQVSKDILSSI